MANKMFTSVYYKVIVVENKLPKLFMQDFTLGKNPTAAPCVQRHLLGELSCNNFKEFTLGRNLIVA